MTAAEHTIMEGIFNTISLPPIMGGGKE